MVLLTVTPAAKAAIDEYCTQKRINSDENRSEDEKLKKLQDLDLGSPIDHEELIEVSTFLAKSGRDDGSPFPTKGPRLDTLLKGANVYQPRPPSKPEPVCFLFKQSHRMTD